MSAAWTIARKDLKERLRDRSAYIMGIVAPLALALIFGFILNPLDDYEFEATYAVVDLDGSEVSRLFIDGVLREAPGVEVLQLATTTEGIALVDKEPSYPLGETEGTTADALFIIPAEFGADVQSEREVEIQVVGNQSAESNAGIAVSLAEGFASELTSVRITVATIETLLQEEVDRLATGVAVLATPYPAALTDISADTKQLDGTTFYAAGMAIFFLFFTVQFGVTSLLEERHAGTLSRLLAAPISKRSILAGKAISAFLVGVVSVVVLMVTTTLVLEADWGPPAGVALLVLAAVVSALGIVALVSSFARTAEQAASMAGVVGIILGFLGGTFFDVSRAGGLIADLRFVSPHGWFMQGLADLSAGDLGVVVVPVLVMLAFGLVTGGLGLAGLRRGLRP
jgi:ABC-2 type transport system permease protein